MYNSPPGASSLDCAPAVPRAPISPAFGGFRVRGRALIIGGFDRQRREALELAERIAGDVAYLEECLALEVPGVYDERPRRQIQATRKEEVTP